MLTTWEQAVLLLFNGCGTHTRAGGAEVQNILPSFKGSQEMYISVAGLWALRKVIQTLLNKLEGLSNKELVLQAPYHHKVGI